MSGHRGVFTDGLLEGHCDLWSENHKSIHNNRLELMTKTYESVKDWQVLLRVVVCVAIVDVINWNGQTVS